MLGLGLGLSKSPGPLGDPAPFITEWRTDTNGETITIPIITNNTYTITTSDGQEITTNVSNPTVTFSTAGTHEVSISGDIQQISFGITNTSKEYIYDVKQWGTDTTWINFEEAFLFCTNLNVSASDVPNITGASLIRAFRRCELTTFNSVNNWDVSSVEDLNSIFRDSSFNQDISNWDVSNVTAFTQAFRDSPFNQNIGNWDVSSATEMQRMFEGNDAFDQDISGWDISNVTNFGNFMLNADGFSTDNYDALLIGWASQSVNSGLSTDFGNSQYTAGGAAEAARNSLETTFGWNITDAGIGAFASNVFVTEWQTTTAGETLTIPMVTSNTYDVLVLSDTYNEIEAIPNQTGSTTTSAITNAGTYLIGIIGDAQQIQFNNTGDKGKIYDIKQWGTDTTWVSFGNAFYGCSFLNVTASDAPNLSSVNTMFTAFRDANLTTFNNINNWDVSSVTGMSSCFRDSSFNQDIGNWDVSNVTTITGMFRGASKFNQDIGDWNISNVTNMSALFFGASKFNQDISNWDVSSSTNMSTMFYNSDFNQDISGWDVSNVTTMRLMFRGTPFNQDIGGWNVSNVTDMREMFAYSPFNQDIGNWDVSSATNVSTMFYNSDFNQDIGDWNIINVANFTNFLFGTTLSTANYDDLLNGWYSTLKAIYVDPASPPSYPGDGLNIHFGNSVSSSAGSASRTALTQSPFNWTITDGTP